jgi:Na+-translocating ferredoxin:NAD+ oxidoreductase RnfA subunit
MLSVFGNCKFILKFVGVKIKLEVLFLKLMNYIYIYACMYNQTEQMNVKDSPRLAYTD